uniref:Uncharacterized protein n=1 Tax=Panagrolaimus davidi TaxID=227884 RepID=A0A914R0U9_9BILA
MDFWKVRRTIILNTLNEKMISIGHSYELPTFEADDEDLRDMNLQQQNELYFQCIKNFILGEYTQRFYPYLNERKGNRIIFKITKGSHPEVKANMKNLFPLLRDTVQCRIFVCELLKKTDLGLVVRSVAEVLQNFLHSEFPSIVHKLFDEARELENLDTATTFLAADLKVLSNALSRMVKVGMIGGQLISYLNHPETLHLSKSIVPSLFAKCIKTGMQYYNGFL